MSDHRWVLGHAAAAERVVVAPCAPVWIISGEGQPVGRHFQKGRTVGRHFQSRRRGSARWQVIAGSGSMIAGAISLVLAAPGLAASPGQGADGMPEQGGGPPGNNGTVKVDDLPFDDHPNNEPHVDCVFQIDFYGYDEGDLVASATFDAWQPTADKVTVLEDTDIFIGEDDNSGGGSEAGLDASMTYDLTDELQAFEPHPNQGWHVKLTIHADGSQGADTKHKTFWVEGCQPPSGPTTTTTEQGTTTTTETETTTTTEMDTTTSTVEEATTTIELATTTVPGEVPTSAPPTTASGSELPRTGSNSGLMVGLGAALLAVGAGLVATTRVLRRS